MKIALLAIVLALLGLWFGTRMRRSAPESPEPRKIKAPYRAVSLRGAPDACVASKRIAGERFLLTEAPELPLPGCDARQCKCYLVEHDDRRRGHDRRSPFSVNTGHTGTGHYEAERREGKDRRRADQ